MHRDEEKAPTDPPKVALQPPPNIPGDIIQSALHLPLTSLSTSSHVGRKVRIIAQSGSIFERLWSAANL